MTIAIERPTKKSRSAQIREQLGYPIISLNRDFFKGTAIEKEAEAYLTNHA
ncbi:hypothetical protein H6G76_02060 [Nostoc sp. FACHB-152]|uniref:hypothetical protein n=1 Tax=unclassified Nostoc TaxID=2593658 RepID=UPI0016871AFF|nr:MULTISPECIES: hypothetical protein [unclassified Nostoc]MBD2445956.1 hypothetical protein [Nostoc sp. FACHB-152]MBD2467850.1 hypothetical protein [Nostoc sp. FACHB-145]